MLSFSQWRQIQGWPRILCLIAMLPLAVPLTSCNNSCSSFQSNPGGTVNVSSPCLLPVTSVFTGGQVAPQCESCSPSNQLQHLFLTLRGIELHPRTNAGAAPSGWQELVPALEIQPQQFQLGRAAATRLVPTPSGDSAAIPAGSYDRVRLLLATNPANPGTGVAAENKCGSVGLNCAVMGDGRVLPLALDGDALELTVLSEGSADGVFSVLPETENHLLIELTTVWALEAPADEGARLSLVLRGTARRND